MNLKTHLSITLFGILILISNVTHKFTFVTIALIATLIPDADTSYSTLGKYKIFRFLQFFVKHRGIIHSFSFLFLITLFFVLFLPTLALPFFLGYGLHLFVDSFTVEGIVPFYPIKKKVRGKIRTGSLVETGIFVVFLVIDLFLLLTL